VKLVELFLLPTIIVLVEELFLQSWVIFLLLEELFLLIPLLLLLKLFISG
jgi:hypothetical protein